MNTQTVAESKKVIRRCMLTKANIVNEFQDQYAHARGRNLKNPQLKLVKTCHSKTLKKLTCCEKLLLKTLKKP
jgi:hypothetical protein